MQNHALAKIGSKVKVGWLLIPDIWITVDGELNIKETVSLILSDPLCKDGSAWFTTVLFKVWIWRQRL